MSPSDDPLIRRFVEEAGNTTQALGVGRVVGQVYAYLYFSPEPRSLDDLKEGLGISKGSASMSVRQLEQWGAVQRVWVKGDRKDYYTANDYFGRIIRNVVFEVIGKRIEALGALMEAADAELGGKEAGTSGRENHDFLHDRVGRLRQFQKKVNGALSNPLVRVMLR